MEPLNPAILARVQEYRRRPPSPAPKISPPVTKAPKVAVRSRKNPPQHELVITIAKAVCRHWPVQSGRIFSPARTGALVRPRFAVYWLIRELAGWSYPRIGRQMKRDHTTIIHGIGRAEALHATDPNWRQRYEAAKAELQTPVLAVPAGDGTGTEHRTLPAPAVAKPVSAEPCLSPVAKLGRAPDAMPPNSGIGRNNSRGHHA